MMVFIRFFKTLSCSITFFIVTASATAGTPATYATDIEVIVSDHADQDKVLSLSYTDQVKLSKPLTYVVNQLSYTPYFLGSSLVDLSKKDELEKNKNAIINRLKKLNTTSSTQLANQLQTLHFAPKVISPLDIDITQLLPKKDPLLLGKFQLYLPKRPKTLLLVGSIQSDIPISIAIKQGNTLKNYLENFPQLSYKQRSHPWIIQADRFSYQTKNVYWKGKPTYLAPGAIIFVGLENVQEPDLNQHIVNLLSYRVEQ